VVGERDSGSGGGGEQKQRKTKTGKASSSTSGSLGGGSQKEASSRSSKQTDRLSGSKRRVQDEPSEETPSKESSTGDVEGDEAEAPVADKPITNMSNNFFPRNQDTDAVARQQREQLLLLQQRLQQQQAQLQHQQQQMHNQQFYPHQQHNLPSQHLTQDHLHSALPPMDTKTLASTILQYGAGLNSNLFSALNNYQALSTQQQQRPSLPQFNANLGGGPLGSAYADIQNMLRNGQPNLLQQQSQHNSFSQLYNGVNDKMDLVSQVRAMAEMQGGMTSHLSRQLASPSMPLAFGAAPGQQCVFPSEDNHTIGSHNSVLRSEPPQVRTLTLVCDLFSPHKGQVNLLKLAEKIEIKKPNQMGIIGLSCQYKMKDGQEQIVVRGKVKEAKRHFAHQAQLRLSLPGSPNISVKVFSTGRLQIAGCREEQIGVSAVRVVAEGVNEVMMMDSTAIQRQYITGPTPGAPVPGPLDLNALPQADIVMINCSFDSGFGRLGFGLNPLKLTEKVRELQGVNNNVEEVSYTPEMHYTGVKIKYRTHSSSIKGGGDSNGQSCKEVFIGIFPSGKAVITGASAWTDVDRAYEFARSTLAANFDAIKVPLDQVRPNRKKSRSET
jgi:hypothetical protein